MKKKFVVTLLSVLMIISSATYAEKEDIPRPKKIQTPQMNYSEPLK